MHAETDRIPGTATLPLRDASVGGPAGRARAVALLRQLPLFDGVIAPSLEDAFAGADVVSHAAGSVLFEAGQPADALYVVVCGRVRLMLGSGPSTRVLAVMGRGDTIGLAALLRGDLYPVTAVAVDETMLVSLPAATVRHLMEEQPRVAARLVGDMGAKLARFVRDIGGFTQRSARARVARLLCDLHRDARVGGEPVVFAEPKRAIASRLAMTPETLSRELHALAELRMIESRRTSFKVLDVAALERAAEDAMPVAGVR
jgi:CRP-like cAMP-binding protein